VNNLPRILLVDERAGDRKLASLVLAGEFGDLDFETASSAAEFSAALQAARFGFVITEARFSWGSGLDVVRLVRQARPDCPVVLFTGEDGEELWSESLALGVDGYVSKTSEGFVRLPSVVRSVFFRTRRRATASTRDAPYRRLFEALPVGVFVATLDGEILEANPAFAALLGLFDPEEAAWSSFPSLFALPAAADRWRTQMAVARFVGNLDAQLRRSDGALTWARVSSWVVEDPSSGVRHAQGIVEETGAFHAAQDELADKAASLERSNDELEQFAYVVSHDLQQPLSVVSSYLELLGDSCRGKLSAEEESYLERAARGTVRVQEMVDAVLNYARVDSRGGEFSPVDLGGVLEEVKRRLWKEIACAKAEITGDPLPTVEADASQMEQLLQNLLSNALKFAGGTPARVHLSAVEVEAEWRISMRDEGIGIDPKAADRVFVMFQRLHTEREFPGTGIGLAICKRIVERHGGQIWFESQPLRGTTFFFTLPHRSPGRGAVKSAASGYHPEDGAW
jgi:PAS domain S-box-containing protein